MANPLQTSIPGVKKQAPGRPNALSIDGMLREARQLGDAGRSLEAIDRLEAVLRAEPRNMEALFLIGLIAAQHKVFDMAIDHLTRAMRLQPNNATIRHYLGRTHLDNANPEQAERQLKKALSLAPGRPAVMVDLGQCYEHGGKPAKAIEIYQAVLARNPDLPEAIIGLGMSKEQAGDHTGAERTFRDAIDKKIAVCVARVVATTLVQG
jgi:cytochrome c-type biogenesis protein CcmH/NrfG